VLCNTKADGRARHIGIANFTVPLIEEAVKLATEPLSPTRSRSIPFLTRAR